METLNWTATNGTAIRIDVDDVGYIVYINNVKRITTGMLTAVPAAAQAQAKAAGVVAFCGPVALTQERKDALEALRAAANAAPVTIPAGAELSELEYDVECAQERVRDMRNNPAPAYAALQAAEAALADWKAAHPVEWAEEVEFRAQMYAANKAEHAEAVQRMHEGRD
ncbi:MAG: hypothetical protein IVW57_08035 [Ktedonobacterales bacterium]|nr:hypothetical protein [Ktedonobacterales bacterium]